MLSNQYHLYQHGFIPRSIPTPDDRSPVCLLPSFVAIRQPSGDTTKPQQVFQHFIQNDAQNPSGYANMGLSHFPIFPGIPPLDENMAMTLELPSEVEAPAKSELPNIYKSTNLTFNSQAILSGKVTLKKRPRSNSKTEEEKYLEPSPQKKLRTRYVTREEAENKRQKEEAENTYLKELLLPSLRRKSIIPYCKIIPQFKEKFPNSELIDLVDFQRRRRKIFPRLSPMETNVFAEILKLNPQRDRDWNQIIKDYNKIAESRQFPLREKFELQMKAATFKTQIKKSQNGHATRISRVAQRNIASQWNNS